MKNLQDTLTSQWLIRRPATPLLRWVCIALIAAIYFLGAVSGLSLATVSPSATAVWPATGLAIASLLVFGAAVWPAVFIGALAANITTGVGFWTSAAIASGNTLEAVIAWSLITQLARGREVFDRAGTIGRYVAIIAPLACAISATIGCIAVVGGRHAVANRFGEQWLTWWLGDLASALIVMPLILLWANNPRIRLSRAQTLEAILLLAMTVLIGTVTFGGVLPHPYADYPHPYLCIPILLWAALRMGPRGTITVAAAITTISVLFTAQGRGPFVVANLNDSLLLLQSFCSVVTVTSLIVAALVLQQRENQTLQIQQRHRLDLALNAGQMGTWEWDINSGRVVWSHKLQAIHGLAPGAFGGHIDDFKRDMHPDDRDRVIDDVTRLLNDPAATQWHVEYRIVRPDRQLVWVEGRGQVQRDSSGQPIKMSGICTDVTARKRAERRLAAEHAITRILADADSLEAAAAAILQPLCQSFDGAIGNLWIIDPDSNRLRCVAVSSAANETSLNPFQQATRNIQFASGESLPGRAWNTGRPAAIVDLENDHNLSRREVALACGLHSGLAFPVLAGHELLGVFEFFTTHRFAPDAPLLQTLTSISHEIAQFVQRKRFEKSLRESESRERARAQELAAIMDAVPALVWFAHDPECSTVTGNKAAQEFLRLTDGANHSKTAPPDQRPTTFRICLDGREIPDSELPLQLCARTGQPIRNALVDIVYEDGSIANEFGNITPLFDEAGRPRGAVAAFMDVTAVQDNKRQLQRQLAQLHAVYDIARAVGQAQSLDEIYRLAIDCLLRTLRADRISILLFDEDRVMRFKAWHGLSDEYRAKVEGHSPWKYGEIDPKPQTIADISSLHDLGELRETVMREGIAALAFIPLISDRTLLGKFMIYHNQPHQFTDEEIELAQAIARHVAFAVERLRSQRALFESQRQFQIVTDAAAVAVTLCNRDFTYRWVSKEYAAWRGLEVEDIIGRSISDVLGEDAFNHLLPRYQQVLAGQEVSYEELLNVKTIGPRWIMASYRPSRNDQGEVDGWVAVVVDITNRKRQEDAIRRSEALARRRLEELRAVYRDAPVGLCFVDCDMRIIKVNDHLAGLIGSTVDQLVDRLLTDIALPGDDWAQALCKVISTGEPLVDQEIVLQIGDDAASRRDLLRTLQPIRDDNGTILGVNCVLQDITHRKNIEREIQHHREGLEHLVAERTAELMATHERLRLSERMAAMGTLSAGLGHDMGNLLLPIRSRLEVLQALNLPGNAVDHVKAIELCVKHLHALVRGLRLFAQDPQKHEDGAYTDLIAWKQETEPFFRCVLPKTISLTFEMQDNLPPVAIAPHALTQAIHNLINNSRDAIGHKRAGVVIINARMVDNKVQLSVIDDGPGMSSDVRARAVEPFYTTKTRTLSTGLGLSMVHGLARAAGGDVQIHSPPQSLPFGCGTEIMMVLTSAKSRERQDSQSSLPAPVASVSVSNPRTHAILTSVLKSMGYKVVVNANGRPEVGEVWFTEPALDRIPHARAFLENKPDRAVVIIGDPTPEWRSLPIRTIGTTCTPGRIREALATTAADAAPAAVAPASAPTAAS